MLMDSGVNTGIMGCCCQDDRDILKALNKAQADRIKYLEVEVSACKEQKKVDQAVKKDLDEKLDKVTADYRALWVENEDLKRQLAGAKAQCENTVKNRQKISELFQEVINLREQQKVDLAVKKDLDEKLDYAAAENRALSQWNEDLKSKLTSEEAHGATLESERNSLAKIVSEMKGTIRDIEERNKTLVERLAKTNESLRRSIQENNNLRDNVSYFDNLRRCQAKEIKRLHEIVNAPNGSCSAHTQKGMQSKIAKQANEIKRLTHENVGLVIDMKRSRIEIEKLKQGNWDEMERLQNANAKLEYDNFQLKQALGTSAKDAIANFERGHHKGQEELWGVLQDVSEAASMGFDLEPVYGYNNMSDVVANLTASAFLKKTEEDEKKAKDIQIGDEVEIFDKFCPDNDPHSDIGIVVMIYEPQTDCEPRVCTVVGPKFEAQIDVTDIEGGIARKTGRHFDSIPLDYLA